MTDPRVTALAATLRLNTRLFDNCLEGLADDDARRRPGAGVNSPAFVAAHLTDARYLLLRQLGVERTNPFAAKIDKARSQEDIRDWPTLAEIHAAWHAVAAELDQRIAAMSAAELDAAVNVRFPVEWQTTFGVLTFLVQHDSYHVGQLALLRKHAGLGPMKYR